MAFKVSVCLAYVSFTFIASIFYKGQQKCPSLFFVLHRCVVMKPPASVISPGREQTAVSGIQLGTFIPPRMKDPRVCVISVSIPNSLNSLVFIIWSQ